MCDMVERAQRFGETTGFVVSADVDSDVSQSQDAVGLVAPDAF